MTHAAYTIRTGADGDWTALGRAVAEIQDFEHAIIGYPLRPGADVWEDYLSDLRHRLSADEGVFLIAEAMGEIIGVLAGYAEQAGDRLVASVFDRSAYVSDLFVQSEWRRQGIGAALMLEFEGTMRAKGLRAALDDRLREKQEPNSAPSLRGLWLRRLRNEPCKETSLAAKAAFG
jgi:ribosomal protein S18 acetylase RimI-like enzyme